MKKEILKEFIKKVTEKTLNIIKESRSSLRKKLVENTSSFSQELYDDPENPSFFFDTDDEVVFENVPLEDGRSIGFTIRLYYTTEEQDDFAYLKRGPGGRRGTPPRVDLEDWEVKEVWDMKTDKPIPVKEIDPKIFREIVDAYYDDIVEELQRTVDDHFYNDYIEDDH